MSINYQLVILLAAQSIRQMVALIFLTAAIAKILHWNEFRGVVRAYRLLPGGLVSLVTVTLPLIELLLGVALLIPRALPWLSLLAAVLLLAFALAMAINLKRGRTEIDCGCFQSALRQPLAWGLVLRNGVCAVLVLTAGCVPTLPDLSVWLSALPAGVVFYLIYLGVNALVSLTSSRQRVLRLFERS